MRSSTLRFTSFPRTQPPPSFLSGVIEVFAQHEPIIASRSRPISLNSNQVLATLGPDLGKLGFVIENRKQRERISRPVFYGEHGRPTLNYNADAYNDEWHCGLEVEAARAYLGNAFYRNLIQAMLMVDVDHLIIAVANRYSYGSGSKPRKSNDYDNLIEVANALYGHTRMRMPYGLTLIGY